MKNYQNSDKDQYRMPSLFHFIKGAMAIEACNKGRIWQMKDKIYLEQDQNRTLLFRMDLPVWKKVALRFRCMERLLRTEIRACRLYRNRLYAACSGYLLSYDFKTKQVKKELEFRAGMRAPLMLEVISNVKGFCEQLCFGEYFMNKNREAVRIWSLINDIWEMSYEFQAGDVRHIHGIKADPYRNQVYIMTGDSDEESAIWAAGDNFNKVEQLLFGDQQSRICQLQVRRNGIVCVTDSEKSTNRIYDIRFVTGAGDKRRLNRTELGSLDGSVIYGCCDDKNETMFFSTTVEPDKGGIHSDTAKLYRIDRDMKLHCMFEAKKDRLPMKLFQYGIIKPVCHNGVLYASVSGLQKYDGGTLVWEDF